MMSPNSKKRLIQVLSLLLSLAAIVGLILYALSQNLNVFYTPQELLSDPTPTKRAIRVGGMVKPGSVKRGEGLLVSFTLTDFHQDLNIQYAGILPDLFKENQGIVAFGTYQPEQKAFIATQVLAKHDENYMPPELKSIQAPKEGGL